MPIGHALHAQALMGALNADLARLKIMAETQKANAEARVPDLPWREFKAWYAERYGPVGDE